MYGGITTNTRTTYSVAVRRYLSFCSIYHLEPLPVTQSNALRFLAHMSQAGLSLSTVKVYLAGLRSWCIDIGAPLPLVYTPTLSQAMKALERRDNPTQAAPILYAHLTALAARIPLTQDNLMAFSAMLLAFFGCLRPAEYLHTRGVEQVPLRQDITFNSDYSALELIVRRAKTNPKGFVVTVGCSRAPLCAVCMLRYIVNNVPAHPSSPLFFTADLKPLSYSSLSSKLRYFLQLIGLSCPPYSLHSLRAGAATAAAIAGCSEHDIQRLGRWSSLCYRRYIRPSSDFLASLAPRLVTSHHS